MGKEQYINLIVPNGASTLYYLVYNTDPDYRKTDITADVEFTQGGVAPICQDCQASSIQVAG